MLRILGLFFTSLLLIVGFLPTASIARDDVTPGSRYTSARAAGMADAFLPLADDGLTSLFYNPAGLARVHGIHFTALDVGLQANSGAVAARSLEMYKIYDLQSYLPQLTDSANVGKLVHVKSSVATGFYMRRVAVGLLNNTSLSARASEDGTLYYKTNFHLIPAAGVAFRFASGIFRLGYSLQWVNQITGSATTTTADTAAGHFEGLKKGSGFSHTIGAALTLPYQYLPALNVVCRNCIFGTQYMGFSLVPFGSTSKTIPDTDQMTFDASISINPKFGKSSYAHLVLQLKDFLGTVQTNWFARLSIGTELVLFNRFALRVGYGNAAPTFGLGYMHTGGEFSFAYYTEEVGATYGQTPDPRFLLQYKFNAF